MEKFPENFLLGASTAAHQVEGNNIHSDYYTMELMKSTSFAEPSADAVDHYNRYEEDIKLLACAGLNCYRFSIEWARIEPVEGQFDEAEVEHYRKMIRFCKDNGVTPINAGSFYCLLVLPFPYKLRVSAEQYFRDFPSVELSWPGIYRWGYQAVLETVAEGGCLVADGSRNESYQGIRQNGCREFASAQAQSVVLCLAVSLGLCLCRPAPTGAPHTYVSDPSRSCILF